MIPHLGGERLTIRAPGVWTLRIAPWILLGGVLAGPGTMAGEAEIAVREKDGPPVDGLTVFVTPAQRSYPFARRAHGTTDERGVVRLTDLEAGTYVLSFSEPRDPALLRPEDNPWVEPPVLTVPAEGPPVKIEIELWRGVPSLFDVRSLDVKLPMGKVVLRHTESGEVLERPLVPAQEYEVHLQETLVEGRWEARLDLPPGYLVLDLRVNGVSVVGGSAGIEASVSGRRPVVEWDVSAPCEVWGRLIPERFGSTVVATLLEPGSWLPGEIARGRSQQRVEAQRWETPTEFHLRLPPGTWRIAPEGERLEKAEPAFVDFTLSAGEVRRQDFVVEGNDESGFELMVEVTEPDEHTSAVGAFVAVYRPGRAGVEPPLVSGHTRERGWPPGRVSFELEPGEYDIVAGHASWLDGRARVDFAPTERKPRVEQRVVLEEGAAILATARDENGHADSEVEVLVTWMGEAYPSLLDDPTLDEARRRRRERTDLTGVAAFRGLAEGPWQIEARAIGERAHTKFVRVMESDGSRLERSTLDVQPPSRYDVALEVLPGGTVSGRLICDDRGPAPPAIAARAYASSVAWSGIEMGPDSPAARLADVAEGDLAGEPEALIDLERLPLDGRAQDHFTLGPFEAGSYVLALRFEGYDGWTWAYATDLREEAAELLLETGMPVDLGTLEGRCAPAVVVRPVLASDEPIPDLRLGRSRLKIEAKDDAGRPIEVRPSVEARRGHLLIRGLVPSIATLELTFEHPHLIPSKVVSSMAHVKLNRGDVIEHTITFERVGGSLVLTDSAPAFLVRSPGENGGSRVVSDSILEGLEPGSYAISACEDPTCGSISPPHEVIVKPYRTVNADLRELPSR